MQLTVIAVSRRPPRWLATGIEEYTRRLPPDMKLRITELAPARRSSKTTPQNIRVQEAKRIAAAVPGGARVIVLDERGRQLTTQQWADQLQEWQLDSSDVVFVIGGAEGLDPAVREWAHDTWALSRLTLPHGIARLLLVEQIYRAWSLLSNHPYHRE